MQPTCFLWMTDPHMEWLPEPEEAFQLGKSIADQYPDNSPLVISGDVVGTNFVPYLTRFQEGFSQTDPSRRVHFVLGNHDYYGRFIIETEREASRTPGWLRGKVVELTPSIALTGEDGWYDGIAGKGHNSSVALNDFFYTLDLAQRYHYSRVEMVDKLRKLSSRSAKMGREVLTRALAKYQTVYFVTHAPPYVESCFHGEGLSDLDHLPWFVSVQMGQMISGVADNFPDKNIVVLCGHTHTAGVYQPCPNVTVYTGGATYGDPKVSRTFDLV